MIPYEIVVPSASRLHLLEPALASLIQMVDQPPERVIVHDDAAFPDRYEEVLDATQRATRTYYGKVVSIGHTPAIGHGPSLGWLLAEARTEYVLYSQDDLQAIRELPVSRALAVMHGHGLHYVGFHKRATMGQKGGWAKREHVFDGETLTLSPHWNFQTGLWRRERMKRVVDWWVAQSPTSFMEHCEAKINRTFNGEFPECSRAIGLDVPAPGMGMDHDARATIQRTFLWGPIGNERYVDNLGSDPKDWALRRPRGGQTGSDKDSQVGERG